MAKKFLTPALLGLSLGIRITSHHVSVTHMTYLANKNHSRECHLQIHQNAAKSEQVETQQHVRQTQVILWPLSV